MELYIDENSSRWLRGQDENGLATAINVGTPGGTGVGAVVQISETVVRVTLLTFPRIADSFTIQGTVSELIDLLYPLPPAPEPPPEPEPDTIA